jgi:hypothetical protein
MLDFYWSVAEVLDLVVILGWPRGVFSASYLARWFRSERFVYKLADYTRIEPFHFCFAS